MPHRAGIHNPSRAQMTTVVSTKFPSLLRKAAVKTGHPSTQSFVREILAVAVASILDMDIDEVNDGMPPNRAEAPRFGGYYGHNTRKPQVPK